MSTPKNNLSLEEQEILDSYDSNEWTRIENHDVEISRFRQYARASLKKDKRINIRITQATLEAIQTRALEEGIPYQTLITSVLHKYINGRLVERQRD